MPKGAAGLYPHSTFEHARQKSRQGRGERGRRCGRKSSPQTDTNCLQGLGISYFLPSLHCEILEAKKLQVESSNKFPHFHFEWGYFVFASRNCIQVPQSTTPYIGEREREKRFRPKIRRRIPCMQSFLAYSSEELKPLAFSSHSCQSTAAFINNPLSLPQPPQKRRTPLQKWTWLVSEQAHFATAALRTWVLKNPPFVRSMTCW